MYLSQGVGCKALSGGSELGGCDDMHLLLLSMTELSRWVKPRLSDGELSRSRGVRRCWRSVLAARRLDPSSRSGPGGSETTPRPRLDCDPTRTSVLRPDFEVAIGFFARVRTNRSMVERAGRLVVGVVLPRNRVRHPSRQAAVTRAASCHARGLRDGANLLLDCHEYPLSFSFANAVAQQWNWVNHQHRPESPLAVSPLPVMVELVVLVDLELFDTNAARGASLE